MEIKDLVKKNRSFRRFENNRRISREELEYFVELARFTASAANRQPLKYFLSYEEETNNKIFPALSWAGYLKDWKEPVKEERPSAYIVVLGDTDITKKYFCDAGIALQTMLLGAVEQELGGCIFAAIDKEKLRKNLNLDERYEIFMCWLWESRWKKWLLKIWKMAILSTGGMKKRFIMFPKDPWMN